MWSAAVVLVCALDILGRSPASLPPIVLLDLPPRGATPGVEAFVHPGDRTIHLITSSSAFDAARNARTRCGNLTAVRKIASVIVHEEWHVRYGSDERGAYEAQLLALMQMGVAVGAPLYAEVTRSMQTVMVSRRERVLATSAPVPFASRNAVVLRR